VELDAQTVLGATDDVTFITGMKTNHPFAIEYTAGCSGSPSGIMGRS
jgi:hypothetical protein